MSLTFSIDTSNSKAKAFIAFIRTLDFIQILDDDGDFTLSDEQKAAVDKAIQSADEGKLTPHNEVMKEFESRYPNYFNK